MMTRRKVNGNVKCPFIYYDETCEYSQNHQHVSPPNTIIQSIKLCNSAKMSLFIGIDNVYSVDTNSVIWSFFLNYPVFVEPNDALLNFCKIMFTLS